MRRHWWALLAVAGLVGAAPSAQAQGSSPSAGQAQVTDPLARGQVYNIVDWNGGKLPQRYERSDQLPLSMEDVRKLAQSKFSEQSIVKMLEQRRCACDASVDGLVALKQAGVSEAVIQAVSLHSLAPNRALDLVINLDFEGLGGQQAVATQARQAYLYLIVPDGERERVFMGSLDAILAGRWQQDAMVDRTDLMLPTKVRRIAFAASVPLKTYGTRKALVFTSSKPDIYTSADIPEADRQAVQEYEFTYPASSLQHICALQVLYKQDAMLPGTWHLVRSSFQCEWD